MYYNCSIIVATSLSHVRVDKWGLSQKLKQYIFISLSLHHLYKYSVAQMCHKFFVGCLGTY